MSKGRRFAPTSFAGSKVASAKQLVKKTSNQIKNKNWQKMMRKRRIEPSQHQLTDIISKIRISYHQSQSIY